MDKSFLRIVYRVSAITHRLREVLRERKKTAIVVFSVFALAAGGFSAAAILSSAKVPRAIGGSADMTRIENLPEVQQTEARDWLPLFYTASRIEKGETISQIAEHFGVTVDSIISFNGIQNTRTIRPGMPLKIPNQDGILYRVRSSDTLDSIAKRFSLDAERLKWLNAVGDDGIVAGRTVFLPQVKMDDQDLKRINGDLFIWPVAGYISSPFGFRIDPFSGERGFHNGLDIAVPWGTPVKAAMAGTVTVTGYDTSNGNFVMLSHHGGYRTLYLHLSSIGVKEGQYVDQGQIIARAGNTGHSTGSHVHFSVSQYGTYINPRSVLFHY
jgi:murein DD-endopeptidase MepM/ murein hydrolase activator NlpD